MKTINPTTGELIKEYAEMSPDEVNGIIEKANNAQPQWAQKSFEQRSAYLQRISGLLKKRKEKLGQLISREMGKPIAQSIAEVEKCAWACEYYAENAASFLGDKMVETDASKSYVSFKPLGIILSIMPWNFPLWQLFRFAAPALMAGNGVVLKHSENTSGCALEIESLIHDSGCSHDLFRTILVSNEHMKPIIQHSGIAAVTLTGSTKAGKVVAAQAGEALKKTVLELGGNDPYIILKDANIKLAAKVCVTSRLINNGQSCVAAKRFIVVEEVYEAFVHEFTALMKGKNIGDPFEKSTDIGPMARFDLRDDLHKQVQESVEKGARITLGGIIPNQKGSFYPVTILENVKKGMPAYHEELFGPVASIIKVNNEEEAIEVANDSIYGLGAAIFTENVEHAENIANERLQAGCCFVNELVKSDPRIPFGGIKHSGYGRELGLFGIREFVNIKTIYIS